jgi:4-hydroxy-3-methylbut-2-enyl diphosphate reductase
MHVVASEAELETLHFEPSQKVAYLTQTTLAVDETAGVVDALRERFPDLAGPSSADICYATQNRQDAVRALASECDLVLIVGSQNSSNSLRLVEVARRAGCEAHLIDDASMILPEWLADARRVGLSAGASAPEALVAEVLESLDGLGGVSISERTVAEEDVYFKLPPGLRKES